MRSHRRLRDGMRRWTNGLPGATQRLGAMMTHRGLSASQPWMRADTQRGPERNRSTSEAEYIDAALTFALSELHLAPHGRAIHPGTTLTFQRRAPIVRKGIDSGCPRSPALAASPTLCSWRLLDDIPA